MNLTLGSGFTCSYIMCSQQRGVKAVKSCILFGLKSFQDSAKPWRKYFLQGREYFRTIVTNKTCCEVQVRCQSWNQASGIVASVIFCYSVATHPDISPVHQHMLHRLMHLNTTCSFSVLLLLQCQKLADSPPRMQCSSCVICRRSSDPTSSSSPTSSAMRPECCRLESLACTLTISPIPVYQPQTYIYKYLLTEGI